MPKGLLAELHLLHSNILSPFLWGGWKHGEDTKTIFKQSNTFLLQFPLSNISYFIQKKMALESMKMKRGGKRNLIIYIWHKQKFTKILQQKVLLFQFRWKFSKMSNKARNGVTRGKEFNSKR